MSRYILNLTLRDAGLPTLFKFRFRKSRRQFACPGTQPANPLWLKRVGDIVTDNRTKYVCLCFTRRLQKRKRLRSLLKES